VLTDKQKADLKRKFSRMDALGKTGQAIRAKAFDISEHFRQHWQGTGFKAQLGANPPIASTEWSATASPQAGHPSEPLGRTKTAWAFRSPATPFHFKAAS
jgi:type I restriction enzyme R subunit